MEQWRMMLVAVASAATACAAGEGTRLRVATFNVEDLRTEDLTDAANARAKALAEVVQRIRPNVILLNEIAYDQAGSPGFVESDGPGRNGQRFADSFLGVSQGAGLAPLRYRAFMAPVNTGMASGFDLDNDGRVVTAFPPPDSRNADGSYPPPSAESRAYANDCWGFGTFPGQYGMALLVDERLVIEVERVRTFRLLPWSYIDGNFMPMDASGRAWFDEKEAAVARLSSKNHWDVPVRLPDGAILHLLCSHPTPPAFDGPEKRNARRNHDEIRFWADYLTNAAYIVDDKGVEGGLAPDAHFVVLGDLNADQDEGSSFKDPIGTVLGSVRHLDLDSRPQADLAIEGLDPDDTAMFGLRVDYLLPSRSMRTVRSGVWRANPASARFPSDHFPVWMDLEVPSGAVVLPGAGAID